MTACTILTSDEQRLPDLPETAATPVIVIRAGFSDGVRKELGDGIAPDAIHGAV